MTSNPSKNPGHVPVPGGFNGAPPKYLNDFTKTLASEVRILLDEVGKLREERRQLQFEIAELMAVKSKHGGDLPSQWGLKDAPPAIEGPPPPDPGAVIPAEPPAPARPGWRVVHKREKRERKPRGGGGDGAPPMSPSPGPMLPPEPPRPNLPAWAQWRPNPMYSPAMHPIASPMPGPPPVESRSGIFGPSTPPPK